MMTRNRIVLVLFLLTLAALTFIASLFYSLTGPEKVEPYTLEVQRGSSLRKAANTLEKTQTIQSAFKFVLLAKLLGKEQNLKWGEYEFSVKFAHPLQVLRQVTDGNHKKYKLTVPEGYNALQIAELLQYHKLADAEQFASYVLNETSAQTLNIPGPTLEGYLFPTTYFLPKGMSVELIAAEMVAHYKAVMTPDMHKRMEELQLTEREVVTLASIIEKETSIADERGQIAAVFHNRLKRNMRLQADPTVIYGIDNFDGNITKKHLQTHTPYNTYKIKGLPPGPIASPGQEAIVAALYPEQSDFLYFVADRKGAHDFSRTYKEHYEKVLRYQIRKR